MVEESERLIPAGKLPALFSYLRERGLSVEDLVRSVASDPDAWRDSATSVPLDLWLAFNRKASATLGDPDLGLGFGFFFWGMPTMLGHLISACRDVGEALGKFIQYQDIEHHSWRFEARPVDGGLAIHFIPLTPLARDRLIVDFSFANFVGLYARLTGREISPRLVRLAYAEPERVDAHRKAFRCPIEYGCDDCSLIVGNDILSTPIRTANPEVAARLEEPLERALRANRLEMRHAAQTLEIFARRRGGTSVTLSSVARELGYGVRDFQSRLKAEGTTFLALRERFLRETAMDYIGDETIGFKEIAFLLGFSEASAFHRAFVRWTGITPGEARARGCASYGSS